MESIKERKIYAAVKNDAIPGIRPTPEPVPEGLFQLPTVIAFIGKKASGKTTQAVNLSKSYQDFKSINTIYILSPTYESNPEFKAIDVDPSNIYTNMDTVIQDLLEIEQKIIQSASDYEAYLEYKKAYKRWKNGDATLEDMIMLEQNMGPDNIPQQPPHQDKPKSLLLIDDLSHTDIYGTSKNNPLINMSLRHRHIGGLGYGVSIFMMVQTFKTGIPRALRQGAVSQFFLWENNDNSNLKEMYESIGNSCSEKDFEEMFMKATYNSTIHDHNFLIVDPYEKDRTKRFRKGYNTLLIPPSIFRGVSIQTDDITSKAKKKPKYLK